MIQMLKDTITDKTALQQLSFVDDAVAEEIAKAEERGGRLSEMMGNFGTGE
jgi:hypothetical protein